MPQGGVGGSGSVLGALVAKKSQLRKTREQLHMTPGVNTGTPQGGVRSIAPVRGAPAAAPAPAAKPAQRQAPAAAPAPQAAPQAADPQQQQMLAQVTDFLDQLRTSAPKPAPAAPQSRGSQALGRARQMFSGGF